MTGKRSIRPNGGKDPAIAEETPPWRQRGGGGGAVGGSASPPRELSLAVWFLRAAHNWTQKELAEASGVHQSRISLYEAGRRTPSRDTLARLAAGARFPMYLLDRLIAVFRSTLAAASLGLPAPPSPAGPAPEDEAYIAAEVARAVSAAVLVAAGELGTAETPENAALTPAQQAAAERAAAPRRWALLAPFDSETQRFLVENAAEHRSFALCELVCEESAEVAAREPERALALADLALFIAERAEGDGLWRLRLQGYAWAFVGNARRAAADSAGAEDAFARALTLWDAGAAADPGLLDASLVHDLAAPVAPRAGSQELPEG
jgi:transcriptional regulator with XRE-family HTH domain